MSAHCVSVKVMRIKVTSHLATLNHDEVEMGILKRQQSLVVQSRHLVDRIEDESIRL